MALLNWKVIIIEEMNWIKLGKICDPTEFKLSNNCFEFAQSPQAIVFDDFVRIYFSTRERDATGKYLSHVSFVDFDKDFKKIIRVSDKTVIPLGKMGCFDEHGIFPMNVLRSGDKILAYFTGWNRKISVSADASIGLAISTDNGLTFQKNGDGPILTASLHEPFLVCDAFVAVFENVYHMWYIYGCRWFNDHLEKEPQRVYKIVYATSSDGLNWHRDGIQLIDDILDENECQALPTVIWHNGLYRMYFCFRHATDFRNNKDRGYRLGYAYSPNLINWTRADNEAGIETTEGEWDSDMMCYPHIFRCNNKVFMLYNGNNFGRYGFGLAELTN